MRAPPLLMSPEYVWPRTDLKNAQIWVFYSVLIGGGGGGVPEKDFLLMLFGTCLFPVA